MGHPNEPRIDPTLLAQALRDMGEGEHDAQTEEGRQAMQRVVEKLLVHPARLRVLLDTLTQLRFPDRAAES